MTNLKDTALNYIAPKLKNVADLNAVSIDMEVLEELDCEFAYKYVQSNGERYKISNSVIADMKEILTASPNIKSFKVVKKGVGKLTSYTVIPLA